MKTLIILSTLILSLGWVNHSKACSIQVNHLYEKNLLVGYAAGEMNVDLSKATQIQISDYSLNTSGGSGGASCPTHLNTSARITVNYKKNAFTQCSFAVTVSKSEQIGEELAEGPLVAITTELPISSCALVPLELPRRKVPIPHL